MACATRYSRVDFVAMPAGESHAYVYDLSGFGRRMLMYTFYPSERFLSIMCIKDALPDTRWTEVASTASTLCSNQAAHERGQAFVIGEEAAGWPLICARWSSVWDPALRREYAKGAVQFGPAEAVTAANDQVFAAYSDQLRRWRIPVIPVWPGVLVNGSITAILLLAPSYLLWTSAVRVVRFTGRRFRRRVPGHCDCGYDLSALVRDTCPECGRPTSVSTR